MRARGFTLIEMAIVITIIGLLLSTFTAFWKVYQKQRERDINNAAIAQVTAAINRFYGEHNYFPCPSGPKYTVGQMQRGIEWRWTGTGNLPPDTTVPGLGRCKVGPSAAGNIAEADGTSGIQRIAGYRVAADKSEPNIITAQNFSAKNASVLTDNDTSVFIGAIPYVTLGLPERFTYDAYGMKLTYAVSASATHPNTYDPNKSSITIQRFDFNHSGGTATQKTVSNDNNSVSFVVYSGGPDRRGVYSRDGVITTACSSVVQSDADFSTRENCDDDALFLHSFSTNNDLGLNAASIPYYFDDIIADQRGVNSTIWESVPGSTTGDVRNVNLGNIGVGTDPHPQISLDVNGNVRADKVITNKICSSSAVAGAVVSATDDKCLDPAALVGDPGTSSGGIACPSGQVLTALGSNGTTGNSKGLKYTCVQPKLTWGGTAVVCPPGEWVAGFNSNGTLCCSGSTCS